MFSGALGNQTIADFSVGDQIGFAFGLDELLRKGRAALERRERERRYRAAQALWHAEALAIPLAHSIQFMPVRKDVVGYKPRPLGKVNFHGVDLRAHTSMRWAWDFEHTGTANRTKNPG